MKFALALAALVSLSTFVVASPHDIVHQHRAAIRDNTCTGKWKQKFRGIASFSKSSSNSNCASAPSCGETFASGYTASINELAYGASSGPGDACGRCFYVKPLSEPSNVDAVFERGLGIYIKVNNVCLPSYTESTSNTNPCDQTVSKPLNSFNLSTHFDLCAPPQGPLSDTWSKFYPFDDKPMIGKFHEVPCSEWNGSEGISISEDSCMAEADAPRWPKHACGNVGCPPP